VFSCFEEWGFHDKMASFLEIEYAIALGDRKEERAGGTILIIWSKISLFVEYAKI